MNEVHVKSPSVNSDDRQFDRPTITAYQLYDQPLEITPGSPTQEWMRQTTDLNAMRCMPLRVASQHGWIIRNSHRVVAVWSGEKSVDAMKILYHPIRPEHLVARSVFGDGILSFQIPYLFRTTKGYNLLVRGPANYSKDAVSPLEGLVETDWLEASFLMSWQVTRPTVPIVFEVGEPICMIVPQRRGDLERFEARIRRIEDDPQLAAGFQAWRESRNQRNLNRQISGPSVAWQMDYARGSNVSGNEALEHQTRVDLARFEPL